MLNVLSVIIGVMALLFGIVAFIPLLGWGYWLVVPLAMIGAVLGFLSPSNTGRNLNLVVIAVGIVRLALGEGII